MNKIDVHEDKAFLRRAQEAIELPDVQEMLARLSAYGLGVFVPHYHPPSGGMAPLPKTQVALEAGLKVSFVDEADPVLSEDGVEDIGWRWDAEKKTVMKCTKCSMVGCRH